MKSVHIHQQLPQECMEHILTYLPPKQRFINATEMRWRFVQKRCLPVLRFASIWHAACKGQCDLIELWTQLPALFCIAAVPTVVPKVCENRRIAEILSALPATETKYISVEKCDAILSLLNLGCGETPTLDSRDFFEIADVVDAAECTGVLDWFRSSLFVFEYTERAIDRLCCRIGASRLDVDAVLALLNWWKHSGEPLKYSEVAVDEASANGYIRVLDWWKHSGLEIKYSAWAISGACTYGRIDVLWWWKQSGLDLVIDLDRINVLAGTPLLNSWWRESDLIDGALLDTVVVDEFGWDAGWVDSDGDSV